MTRLIENITDFISEVFSNGLLVSDPEIKLSGKEVVNELKERGFVLRKEMSDKQARSVFVTIQASSERKIVDDVTQVASGEIVRDPVVGCSHSAQASTSDETARPAYISLQAAAERSMVERLSATARSDCLAKSIWIIHTPTIATPCVTTGEATPLLLAEEIMQDESRRDLTLSRASIIRDYLKAGGILIIAHDRSQINKRTPEQLEIYNSLIQEYPKQLIDFPMTMEIETQYQYPLDLIGATYLVEDTQLNKFEMTNLGVQAYDARNDATWGVWMQNRSRSIPEVTQRMGFVFSFLEKAGLGQRLNKHAQEYEIDPDTFAALLSRYMDLKIDKTTGVGCAFQ